MMSRNTASDRRASVIAAISGGTTTTRHSARSITARAASPREVPKVDEDYSLPADDDVEDAAGEIASHQVDLLGSKRAGEHAHTRPVVDDVLPQHFLEVVVSCLGRAGDRPCGDEVREQGGVAERGGEVDEQDLPWICLRQHRSGVDGQGGCT